MKIVLRHYLNGDCIYWGSFEDDLLMALAIAHDREIEFMSDGSHIIMVEDESKLKIHYFRQYQLYLEPDSGGKSGEINIKG